MAPLALIALVLAQSPSGPSVRLAGSAFVVEDAGVRTSVPVARPASKPATAVVYREGETYAVWDVERGLSIRKGESLASTRLPEVAVSKRLFSPEEVAHTESLFEKGVRSPAASGLAGSVRVGDTAFFLVQWRDKKGEPWLETLLKVELKDAKPIIEMVGRFEGFSMNRSEVGDELGAHEGKLLLVAAQGDAWGIARYSVKERNFSFDIAGAHLARSLGIGSRTVVIEERTSYGTSLLARVYLPNGARRNLIEVRGKVELLDTTEPLLARVVESRGISLRNLDTGAILGLPGDSLVERTPAGVLVASPPGKPTAALLYDPVRWERRALWSAGPTVSGGG